MHFCDLSIVVLTYVEESHLTLSLSYYHNQEMWLETQHDLVKAQHETSSKPQHELSLSG